MKDQQEAEKKKVVSTEIQTAIAVCFYSIYIYIVERFVVIMSVAILPKICSLNCLGTNSQNKRKKDFGYE